jgi:hypothetical protein
MRRLLPFFSLLLAVFWLPATEHCALETMGLVGQTCSDNRAPGQPCSEDDCGTVENGAYKPSVDTLKAPTPDLRVAVCFLCSHLIQSDATRTPAILPGDSFNRPRDWFSTWHFVRRAAPSPRAPSLSLA